LPAREKFEVKMHLGTPLAMAALSMSLLCSVSMFFGSKFSDTTRQEITIVSKVFGRART
jgi:hypothetical protein